MAAAVVFGWVVPRGLQREAAGATALTLSILGLVAVLAFWAGLTPILAGGGALLGWAGRNQDRGRGMSRAAIVIGALALVGYLVDLRDRRDPLSRGSSGGPASGARCAAGPPRRCS